MISVLAALVLRLLAASVKNAFDATDSQIRQFASTLILLNETLKDYGPETTQAPWPARTEAVARMILFISSSNI